MTEARTRSRIRLVEKGEWLKVLLLIPILASVVVFAGLGIGIAEIFAQDYLSFDLRNIALQTVTLKLNATLSVAARLLIPLVFFLTLFLAIYRKFSRAVFATAGSGLLWMGLMLGVFYALRKQTAGVMTHNLPDVVRKTLTLGGFFDYNVVGKIEAVKVLGLPFKQPFLFVAILVLAIPCGMVFERLVSGVLARRKLGFLGPWAKGLFWISFTVAIVLAGSLNAITYAVRHRANIPQPNVLVISIDTLRHDALGIYGSTTAKTPAIDQLASGGAVFENAYSHSPWTLPSHASMFTGLTPTLMGIRKVQDRLGKSAVTLPEVLKNYGFASAAITSYILVSPAYGFDQGFDQFLYNKKYTADEIVNMANAFITQKKKQKFFLFLHLFDPHWPYHPNLEKAKEFWTTKPTPEMADIHNTHDYYSWVIKSLKGSEESLRFTKAMYDAEVSYVDNALQRLFTHLAEEGVANQTAIIITSDHGEEFLEHGLMGHGLTLYDESIRVPLIVRFPSMIPGNSRIKMPVQMIDLYPTILSLVGIENPIPYLEGRDLTSEVFLADRDQPRDFLAESAMAGETRFAVIQGDHKYLTPVDLTFGEAIKLQRDSELFNLNEDPGETKELSPENPIMLDHLKGVLTDSLQKIESRQSEAGKVGAGESKELSTEEIERLRSLGYIQ